LFFIYKIFASELSSFQLFFMVGLDIGEHVAAFLTKALGPRVQGSTEHSKTAPGNGRR
jgi:hypothetical protein